MTLMTSLNTYRYTVIEKGGVVPATAQLGIVDYYSVDVKRYRGALRRLDKAKEKLNPIHSELLEMFVYDIMAENHSSYDVYTKISRLNKFLKWLEGQGEDITTCTGFDVSRFLVNEVNPGMSEVKALREYLSSSK